MAKTFPYLARFKWSGKSYQANEGQHAVPGKKTPATVKLSPGPRKGKLEWQYSNVQMSDLRSLNSILGFFNVRRISGVIFNIKGNGEWVKPWNKLTGVDARVPYPLAKGERAIAQGIMCEGNEVLVIAEKGKYAQIKPTVAQLTEVIIGSDAGPFWGALKWRVYPDKKTKEIWAEKSRLEPVP